MQRAWAAVIGFVGAAAALAASCNDTGGGNSAAITSCRAYCDKAIGAGCAEPIYASAGTCKAYECSSLDSASERCQTASKAYYDCAAKQSDQCANTGCARELDAAITCGGGGRAGTGGRGGSGGLGAVGGRGSPGGGGGVGGTAGAGGEGGIAGFGGAGGGWSPSVFGDRLVVWLDASTETQYPPGAPMSLWTDRSGYGNHARQPTAAIRPVFSPGAINGLAAVTFNAADTSLLIDDAYSVRFGNGDFVVMVVARAAVNIRANAVLVTKMEAADPFRGLVLFLNASRPDASLNPAIQVDPAYFARAINSYGDTAPHLFGGRQVGLSRSRLEIRVDGAAEGAAPPPRLDISTPGSYVVIGNHRASLSSGFVGFLGDISEVVMIRDTVSDGELNALEVYLMSKYGLL